MALEKFTWENGTQTEPAKVEIDGQSYNVSDAQYEGETPMSAANLNLMQDTLLGNVKNNLSDETKIPSVGAVKGKLLWTNPDATVVFPSQTITLNSDDYDVLIFISKRQNNLNTLISPLIVPRGFDAIGFSQNSLGENQRRNFTYVDDIHYSIGAGASAAGVTDNGVVIPLYVIGYNTNWFN